MRRALMIALALAGCASLETADQQVDRLSRECAQHGVPPEHPRHLECVRDFAALEATFDSRRSERINEAIQSRRTVYTRCSETLGQVTCTTR